MNSSNSMYRILLTFLSLLPLLWLSFYPFEFNKDYLNYYWDYESSSFSYDIGYEIFSYFSKYYLKFDFEEYWLFLLFIAYILLSTIYNKALIFFLSIFTITWMSQFFFGTQIRFAIACLLFIFSELNLKGKKKHFIFILSCFFHYGLFVIYIIYLIALKFKLRYINKMKWSYFLILIMGGLLSISLISQINVIISMTRFSYFQEGSEFLEGKSISSVLYMICIFFLYIIYAYQDERILQDDLFYFGFFILLFCIVFSSIAVLSGRVFLFFSLLEPIILIVILKYKGSDLVKFLIFAAYFVKVTFSIISVDYHTIHIERVIQGII